MLKRNKMVIKQLKFKDLDGLLEWHDNQVFDIHLQTFKCLKNEWDKNQKTSDIDIFKIDFEDDEEYENVILTIYSKEWNKALELGLEYFIEQEEYEMCSQIKNLLTKIKK